MANIPEIITFYKNCFEEENRGGGLPNFLSAKVEKHTLISGKEEHLSGLLPYSPIDEKIAQKLQAEVALYQKEKELIYGSHFLLGKYTGFQGRSAKLIAPLIIYPAEIVFENELYFIQADTSSPTFNPAIIDLIKSFSEDFDETAFFKHLPEEHIGMKENGHLSRLIERHLPGTDASLMVDYPNNLSKYKINKLFKTNNFESDYQLVPCSGFGMVRKSTKTRSTIAELDALSRPNAGYSGPIKSLFNPERSQNLPFSNVFINPAASLSDAQEGILDAALKYNISMAVGPPGTGKSFTIANLAISMMSQGKSVLICSRNDGAVNVIEDKIHNLLGSKQMCIRGGKRDEIKDLKDRLQFLLSRGHIKESYQRNKVNSRQENYLLKEKRIAQLRKELKRFSLRFEKANLEELSTAESIIKSDSSGSLWNRIVSYFLAQKVKRHGSVLWEVTALYLQLTEKLITNNKEHVNFLYSSRLDASISHNRELLKNYLKSLRATNASRQKRFLESIDMSHLFRVFPIWLTNTKDVGEILPLRKELFDIVIIDEASQCDISTCLPLLQRAKSAVIVGDPKQLRHISFLSRAKEHFLQQKQFFDDSQIENFTYREKSILDLAEDSIKEQRQTNFLDEHYRSKPDIIAFSNEAFYFNELKIMTNNLQDKTQSLFQLETRGKRNKKGVNQTEINLIIKEIRKIIEMDKDTVSDQKRSIGILSPFRSQVDQIAATLQDKISFSDIENHQILVGTAHSFQGEERDVMFISFALDNDSHPSAFHFLNKDDVFNVSITRARNKQYLVRSFDKNSLPMDSLVKKYFDFLSSGVVENAPVDGEKDKFSREVCGFIAGYNRSTRIAFSVAGVTIDIVVEHKGRLFGIDLVGYPGPYEKTIELYRYKVLSRAGIKMIPIPYSLWRFNRELCEARICELLSIPREAGS